MKRSKKIPSISWGTDLWLHEHESEKTKGLSPVVLYSEKNNSICFVLCLFCLRAVSNIVQRE